MRELQAEEPPAAPEHAIGFGERLLDSRHVADAEGDGIAVECAVGERQRPRRWPRRRSGASTPRCLRARRADPQHVAVDVGDRHLGPGRRPERPGKRRRRCRRRNRDGHRRAMSRGATLATGCPSRADAGRPTSGRSSGRSGRRPCGTRRPRAPASRRAARWRSPKCVCSGLVGIAKSPWGPAPFSAPGAGVYRLSPSARECRPPPSAPWPRGWCIRRNGRSRRRAPRLRGPA